MPRKHLHRQNGTSVDNQVEIGAQSIIIGAAALERRGRRKLTCGRRIKVLSPEQRRERRGGRIEGARKRLKRGKRGQWEKKKLGKRAGRGSSEYACGQWSGANGPARESGMDWDGRANISFWKAEPRCPAKPPRNDC